jgi:molybdate transport system substrate-binding protein
MPPPLRRAVSLIIGTIALTVLIALPAVAADLTILTSRAMKPVLMDLAPSFLAKTGNTLTIASDSTGGIAARLTRGEEIDLAIMPATALDGIAGQGRIVAGSVTPVAKSGIGIVVKRGAPPPDISSAEALKRTLLATPSLAYMDPGSGDASGVYLAKLFDRLGIAEAIQRKAVLVPGGLTASRVDNGQAALALQQISELHAVSNVTYVGPLPDAVQSYAIYSAGIPTASRRPVAARALLAFLLGDGATQALTARGFDPP